MHNPYNQPAPLRATLNILHAIVPPAALIHLGAGAGHGELHHWRDWNIERALIIDADPERLAWANAAATLHPGWTVAAQTIAASAAMVDYYEASNPDEDGLLPPRSLTALWPNLRKRSSGKRQAATLDDIALACTPAQAVWLLIDCHPAERILDGAAGTLERCDVVVARCSADADGELEQIARPLLERRLGSAGFTPAAFFETNHPRVGHLVYVRNGAAARNAELQREIAALREACDQQGQRYTALDAERDSLAALARSRRELLMQLTQTNDERQSYLTAQAQNIAELQSTLAAQGGALAELRAVDAARAQFVDELQAAATAAEARLAALEDSVAAKDQEIGQLRAQLDAQLQASLAQQKNDSSRWQAALAEQRELGERLQAQLDERAASIDGLTRAAVQREAERDQDQERLGGQLAELTSSLENVVQERDGLRGQIDKLIEERQEAARNLAKRQKRIVELGDALAALEQLTQEQAREHAVAVADAGARIEQLSGECRQHERLLAQRQATIQELNAALADHETLARRVEELTRELEAKTQAGAKRQKQHEQELARMQAIEAENQQARLRQQMIQDDLVRSEAQIELIKDLLLREPGL